MESTERERAEVSEKRTELGREEDLVDRSKVQVGDIGQGPRGSVLLPDSPPIPHLVLGCYNKKTIC